MDRTLIVCASYRGVSLPTKNAIATLELHGARLLCGVGVADVALARNIVLTRALQNRGGADVCLLVDDDMVWELEAARKLVRLARESGECWSGTYATKDGTLAATHFEWKGTRTDGLRMVGLGFCAVPMAKLEGLAHRLGAVIGPSGQHVVPFCQCSIVTPEHDGLPRWCSEDYWFCLAVGGVRLAPHVAAGHLKEVPLWPDDETLRRLAESMPLEPEGAPPSAPSSTHPETPTAKSEKPRRAKRTKRKDQQHAKKSDQTRAVGASEPEQ